MRAQGRVMGIASRRWKPRESARPLQGDLLLQKLDAEQYLQWQIFRRGVKLSAFAGLTTRESRRESFRKIITDQQLAGVAIRNRNDRDTNLTFADAFGRVYGESLTQAITGELFAETTTE